MPAYDGLTIWTSHFMADTTHLTTEEVGAYALLLFSAWRAPDCSLPQDDQKLRKIARCSVVRWNVIRENILEFWTPNGEGRLVQGRLTRERFNVARRSRAGRAAALARWGPLQEAKNRGRG